ncbi:MAG: hypothetical protein KA260_01070 [Burkholderiales bacterium]|nr:hypothetical protein [Burkholderiales bacterium]
MTYPSCCSATQRPQILAGASDIRVGGVAAANRVITAGGGGGGGRGGCEGAGTAGVGGIGGAGGGGNGVNGGDSPTSGGVAGGGAGAIGAASGAAGIGCGGFLGTPGAATSDENGGAGGTTNTSTLTAVTVTQGVNLGNGSVEVCYAPTPPVNGACGTANGVAIGAAPSANLCAAGTASVVASAVGQFTWTCDGANGATNASCAAPRTYTVTPSVSGGNGTATGGGAVVYNATGSVTITPNAGFFTTTPIGGTCGGTLTGGTFTTLPVTADCTVIASFAAQITPSVAASPSTGGSLSCTPQAAVGGNSTCTATPSPGYVLSSFSGCSGVQTGQTTYVTGPLSAACTVTALFVPTAVIPVLTGWWAWFLAAFVAFAAFITVRRRGVSLR